MQTKVKSFCMMLFFYKKKLLISLFYKTVALRYICKAQFIVTTL